MNSTPQPAAAPHRRRWTHARMGAFLRALVETHSVGAAAQCVGMSRQSAYRLRNRQPAGAPFRVAWDMAVAARPWQRAQRLWFDPADFAAGRIPPGAGRRG